MIVIFNKDVSHGNILAVQNKLLNLGFNSEVNDSFNQKTLTVDSKNKYIDNSFLKNMEGVNQIVQLSKKVNLVLRESKKGNTIVDLGNGIKFGEDIENKNNNFNIIAGPCSVESKSQIFGIAEFLSSNGIKILRGGAYKPRTSPYSFQGLGREGLLFLKEASEKYNMKIVTEAVDLTTLDFVSDITDMIQIGARNMQNYELLKACGKKNKPILLKRGFNATIEDLLSSAEYILAGGNKDVVLCERGFRASFSAKQRSALDLIGISEIKELSHLPVIVDPSHAAKSSSRVIPLTKAATAYGCDGLMIEIHPKPETALSDGAQSLNFDQFELLLNDLKKYI